MTAQVCSLVYTYKTEKKIESIVAWLQYRVISLDQSNKITTLQLLQFVLI